MDADGGTTRWDVAAWALGPARPYRINALYRLDGAVVTVTGRCDTPEAAADLSAALHVFEPLAAPLCLDLCHAWLDDCAAVAVVAAGRRRADRLRPPLRVRHAEPATRARLHAAEQGGDRPALAPLL